jgi:hypothetical protein
MAFCGGPCQPGDVIILPSGVTNDSILLRDFRGTVQNHIIVTNTPGAQTVIDTNDVTAAPTYGNGIWFHNSKYMKLDGSNGYDESDENNLSYGIRVTDCAAKGIFLNHGSEGIVIKYIEIDHIGGEGLAAGIGIKENSMIGETGLPVGATLTGLYIHHNYIHDTTTEGIYLTATGGCSSQDCCNSQDDSDGAVIWHDIEVRNNRIDSTGWDSLSVGCCENAVVHDNLMTNAGLANYSGIGQGLSLSLNRGFGGKVSNNTIIGAQKQGIVWMGSGDTDIYNNVIADVGKMGDAASYERMAISDCCGGDSANLTIRYNTIVNSPYEGIVMNTYQNGLVQDNLYVNIGTENAYGSVAMSDNAGVEKDTVAECNFEDAANHNYDITPLTPDSIRISGQTTGYPATDIEGADRGSDDGTTIAVGAYSKAEPILKPPILRIAGASN